MILKWWQGARPPFMIGTIRIVALIKIKINTIRRWDWNVQIPSSTISFMGIRQIFKGQKQLIVIRMLFLMVKILIGKQPECAVTN